MANPRDSSTRTVLEPLTTFDLPRPPASTRSLSALSFSPSQTLIYLATHSGSLLLFSSAHQASVSLTRTVSFGYSPVEVVLLLPEIGKVIALCDGSLFLTDSHLSQPVRKLGFVKGVTFIAKRVRTGESSSLALISTSGGGNYSDSSSSILRKLGGGVRVNGGVKPRVRDIGEGVINGVDVDGNDNNLLVALVGKKLVLVELVLGGNNNNNEGSLVVVKEIPCIDEVMSVVWVNDSIIVGTVNGYSLFSCVTGESRLLFTLPDAMGFPLLKLLRKERKVLLLVDNVGVVVDDQGQPVGGSLVFRRSPDFVEELSSYLVGVKDGKMELYHKKSGSCVQSFVFGGEGVGPCFVASEESGNGQIVAVVTPTKIICYHKVPFEEQIKDLLRKKNFKEAISLVEELECEGELSKEMLSFVHAQVGFLLLFDLHFEEAVNHFLQSETMEPSELFPFIMRDPNRWSLLVPRNRYWGLHPPPAPLEDLVDDGLLAIQRAIFLKKAGVETNVDNNFLANPPNRADLLESAIKNIIRYLEASRQKDLTSSVREGVDTLLMYLHRALNHVDDMEKLASSENSCIVEELETLLDESGHLRTLAFLYASKGISSKALAIWRILARNYSSGLWKDPLKKNSEDNEGKVLSGREIAATEATKILEVSADQGLVLQHLGWVADINPVLAVQVLTSNKRENLLSPDEVIAAIDPKKVEILQRYLQWLIEDQDFTDTQFHTLYALSLAKSAMETFEPEATPHSFHDGKLFEAKSFELGRNSIFQDPVRERLQTFLQSSDLYDPEEVLDLIEGSELWLEKAILYRKLGQETLVLQILALKLEDSEAAEQYCAEIGRPDAYMQLLDMYLDPQNGREPMFKAAVRLLHNHGELLDPLQVLETLSPEMPLQLAAETILRMLRARFHHFRQGQIVHNLSRAIDVDARLARLEERARHVQINDESLCDSCHARLGTKLFAMYPDDSVVCYKCFRRQGESTSVKGRDFKRDILIKPGWLVTR